MGHAEPLGQRIVGRAVELAVIDELVAVTAGGRGATMLVLGEAGIGKSRLLAEAAARGSAAGMEVLRGRAVPAGGTYRALATALVGWLRNAALAEDAGVRPYRAALGRLIPDFGPAGGAEPMVDPAVVVGEGVLRLLRAVGGGRGCLLLLDDLHWADPDTLAVLEYLVDGVADQRILVCCAAREESPTVGRIGRRPAVRVLRPARLDAAEVAELAGDRAGVRLAAATAGFMVDRCDGLPLLVEELTAGLRQAGVDPAEPVSALDVPVPPTLRALVGERLAALTGEHRHLLNVAAVVGVDLGWDVVASVAEVAEPVLLAGLRAATETGLLRSESGELTWRHALTREAVLAALLPPERAAIARRAGRLLDTGGVGEADVRAAELFGAAGDHERAGRILLRLARHDLTRGALRSARESLARVEADGAVRVAWAIEQARLHTLVGEVDAALRTGEAVIDVAAGDEHAELCLQLARSCIVGGRWAAAIAYVERAGRPHAPCSALIRADASYGAGDPDDAAALAADAVREAERSGDGESLASALLARGRCLAHYDAAAAQAAYGRAVQVTAEHGLTPLRVSALLHLSGIEGRERPDPPALDAARELAVSAGLLGQLASIDMLAADLALTAYGPDTGEPVARRCAELAGRLRLTSVQAVAELFVAAARAGAGDQDGARRWLRQAGARPDAPPEVQAGLALVPAIAAVVAGDLPRAAALADEGASVLADFASACPTHWWGLWLLLREVTGNAPEDARAVFQKARADRRPVNRGALDLADAVAAGRLGDSAASAAALACGDAALQAHPWWHRLLRLPVWTAAVTERWGDPVPGLRADLAWHEQNGGDAQARRCRDLLRSAGAPPRRTRGTTVPPRLRALGVTGRETEVLALVAEGLGNAQIAARLHLSVRTVETHVSHLLAKTGAPDRNGLRAYASGQHR
ncbi:ATP-binding protein [Spirillospora sp. CA-253888]